jgi:exopolysaccharide biosynthesis polyprenyl glycosylphosphotransferase
VLIVGGPVHVDEIAHVLQRERWLGYQVVGALTPAGIAGEATAAGVPVIGAADILSMRAQVADIDVLFLAGGAGISGADLRRMVWDLEEQDVQLVMAPSMTEVDGNRVRVQPVAGLPLVHLAPPTWTGAVRVGKRLFDVLGSGFGLLLISPLLLLIALRIKLHDGGPVLFRQTRVGRDGKEFACLKFRTMVVDAEERLAALHLLTGFEGGLFKMEDDPRITRPGRWLRRFSLDELPQLFNVLHGEMSLVGPRPPLPSEVEAYDNDALRRLHIRPGMTGLWQVSGRSNLTFEEAVRLDLFYVDNWSMVQDLTILAKTVGAVLARNGAY